MHSLLVGIIVATVGKCTGAVRALVRLLTCVLNCMTLQKIDTCGTDNFHHVPYCQLYLLTLAIKVILKFWFIK